MSRSKISIDEKNLNELYWVRNLSPYKIGTLLNCSFSTVTNRLKEYEIPFKNHSQARQKYLKKDFSEDPIEKAYMLGFRIGDMNVYKTSPKSETVVTRCHTTDKDQAQLIKNLFNKYGKVTISCNSGHNHVNCFLNKTFEFLLPKFNNPPEYLTSKKEILSFIAGYTDAEGNIGLNQGKARFKIDSYDKGILSWISTKLDNLTIKNKLRCIGIKNKIYYNQKILNQDLWRLNVNNGTDLLKFINLIEPFIRHKRRKQQITQSKINLLMRVHRGSVNESEY